MAKQKLLFYEDLSLDSAIRKKLKVKRPLHWPSGLEPLTKKDFEGSDIEWESVPEAWPAIKGAEFAVSIGHAFTREQKNKFLVTRKLTEFTDLNASVGQFDFSVFSCRPRNYNKIQFLSESVVKTSSWKEKGLAEVSFFRSVPVSIENYYPKVMSSALTEQYFTYAMTHLRCFEVGRLCLESTMTASDWTVFYDRLSRYFNSLSVIKVGQQEVQERLRKLFIRKLSDRLEAFKQFSDYKELTQKFQAEIGFSFESRVHALSERLEYIISNSKNDQVVFSHGDMSFCNILYDIETQKIGLVDPRGKDAVDGCFRPIEYDLAKLSHSALGNYEAIVVGVGTFETDGIIKNAFMDFIKQFSIPTAHLRSYEASLFWSLLPLHLDDPSHLLHFMKAGEQAFQAGQR